MACLGIVRRNMAGTIDGAVPWSYLLYLNITTDFHSRVWVSSSQHFASHGVVKYPIKLIGEKQKAEKI